MSRAMCLTIATSTFLVMAIGATRATPEQEWHDFKKTFAKEYNDIDEEKARFAIFSSNLNYIEATNAKNLTFTLGVNQFADLTEEEFVAHYTGARTPGQLYGDVPYLGEHGAVDWTDSVDWTDKGAVTPVKNQGSCGSCWAFSTTGALEGANFIATGQLVSLSEQFFMDCDTNSGCGGGWPYKAFTYAKSHAACTESSYPYKARAGSCRASSCAPGIKKVTGYKSVSKSENALMSAVTQQPVSVTVKAGGTMQHYKSGVLMGSCSGQINHAVLAVGYGSLNGQAYWKVKNSWAASWGDHGYFLLERGAGGGGAFCVLEDSPSYPIISGGPTPTPSPPGPSPPSPPTDCKCAGVTNPDGDGGSDCKSLYSGLSYCYVQPGACTDGKQSGRMPDFEWSHLACTTQPVLSTMPMAIV